MFDDYVTGYAAIFWPEKLKNYNLLLAQWKILNTLITFKVFGVKKSMEVVKSAVQRPRARYGAIF